MNWLTRLLKCPLVGHDFLPRFAPGHITLECQRCGYRSPGWKTETCKVPLAAYGTAQRAHGKRGCVLGA